MSKIIKAGNCSFLSLNGIGLREEADQDKGRAFNSLSALVEVSPEDGEVEAGGGHGESGESNPGRGLSMVREQAETILNRARDEAESIKSKAKQVILDARKKSEEIESEAYAQGFEQGKKDGEELGRRQYEATAQRLNRIIEKMQIQGSDLFSVYEAQMVQLVLEVARRIVHHEIQTDPETVLVCIRAAMEKVVEGSHLCIHLNPQDAELVEENVEVDLTAPGRHPVEIKPDMKVERGGCLIETEFGFVDATLESKWQAVTQALDQVLVERTGLNLKGNYDPSPDKS